jgi:hypothetical protein
MARFAYLHKTKVLWVYGIGYFPSSNIAGVLNIPNGTYKILLKSGQTIDTDISRSDAINSELYAIFKDMFKS